VEMTNEKLLIENPARYPTPKRVALSSGLIAVCIFVFDFMMASPTFSGFLLIYTLIILLPVTLLSIRNKPKLHAAATKLLVYTVFIAATFGFYAYDLSLARQRSDVVIAAVERYYQQHDSYPSSLLDLVPDYLPSIPKPRIAPSEFMYLNAPENPQLIYTGLSPFERYAWQFEQREWSYLD
jgi:hypothetical protein